MSDAIKIKPCNVGWDQMTPEEKGRHCSLCSKTVVDFTQMKKEEIQWELKNYFAKGQSVCGHFLAKDVDEIVVEVPVQLFSKRMNFHKQFALALLVVMGTSLLSCTNNQGEKERLSEVVITENVRGIDTLSTPADSSNIEIDLPEKNGKIIPIMEGEISVPPVTSIPNEPLSGIPIPPEDVVKGDVSIIRPKVVGEPAVIKDSIPIKENCILPEESDSLLNDVPKIMGKIAVPTLEKNSK